MSQQIKIKNALISVYYKDGLEPLVRLLAQQGVQLFSTGGTEQFIKDLNLPVTAVEDLTGYPSILGGRVKTLHPKVFGGILNRRNLNEDKAQIAEYEIPEIDLVIVDLYPFEETVKATKEEEVIIEKIDIGGPSMIRAAAKNFKNVLVIADRKEYRSLAGILKEKNAETSLEERKDFARKAFDVCAGYDIAISNYFNKTSFANPFQAEKKLLRYGENPHQKGVFIGNISDIFKQLHGKELSYNNLVDVDAALQLMKEFKKKDELAETTFAVIKHTNVCGIAQRKNVSEAFSAALAGDPESAFGGILICNSSIDLKTAEALKDLFIEVLIAPAFQEDALAVLKGKKNRIILKLKDFPKDEEQTKALLSGLLIQENDKGNFTVWKEEGGRVSSEEEKEDLAFANLVCKHLKSNAISIVKNKQLLGKGAGQTSRVDALKHAIEKANQFEFDLQNAVVASDAFFPFDDCVKMAHAEGIEAFIQPGGSIRDKDSIDYCVQHNLAMVMTGMRHFRH